MSIATGWISSVTYVAALSLWALVSGHWSAWQAARVEVEQAKEAEKWEAEKQDLPSEIVEQFIEETDLQAGPEGVESRWLTDPGELPRDEPAQVR